MDGFEHCRHLLIEHLLGKGLQEISVRRKARELERCLTWLAERKMTDIRDINETDIEKYILYLRDEGFSRSSMMTARSTLGDLFLALFRHGAILTNPMDRTDIYIREKAGLRVVLTEEEMSRFLEAIGPITGVGIRDRAMFELMYVTGMRVGELVGLDIEHIDFSQNEVFIKQGKGGKDRIVPLGNVAKRFLLLWTGKARAWFVKDMVNDQGALFLSFRGVRISKSGVRECMKRYLVQAGITKEGVSPHSIRHSCATHLLQGGADIRFVQELLGHESIETTVTYTREIVTGLKKVHKQYHPRENVLYVEE